VPSPANRRAASWLLIACTCVLALAGCSGSATVHGSGTITGKLVAEYRLGSFLNGQTILNLEVPGHIVILSGGKAVSAVQAASDGGFRITVPVGRYTVSGPATKAGPCDSSPRTVRVRRGRVSSVLVFCPRAGRPK
jgi:hypothetical protein